MLVTSGDVDVNVVDVLHWDETVKTKNLGSIEVV